MLRIEKPGRILNCTEHPYTQQELNSAVPAAEFPNALKKKDWYWDIFTYTYTNIDIYAILIFGSAWFYGGGSRTQLVLPEFDLGRLCGMTLYEILSLAIDLAILILAALSYLKDRKS